MELTVKNQNNQIQVGKNLPLTGLGVRLVELINSDNSRAFIRFKSEMTTEMAFQEGNQIQACYKKEPDETIDIISFLIIDFANSINVGKNITDQQVDDIAFTLCSKFKDLSIEELIVIFSNAKAGRYGKIYDRLDVVVMSEFINQYCGQERADYLEKANSSKSFQSNNVLDAIVNSEKPDDPKRKQIYELLQEFGKKPEKEIQYTVTAAIPKHSEYLEKTKKLIPEFSLKELCEYRKEAIRSNWKELISIIDEEIAQRPEENNPVDAGKGKQPKSKKLL